MADHEIVKCPGCGVSVIYTTIYGDWCGICKPRTLPSKKKGE